MTDEQHGLTDGLPLGASYYDEARSTVYYQGDGTSTYVTLPDGMVVVSITPALDYSLHKMTDGTDFVVFSEAVKLGVQVEIVLQDDPRAWLNGLADALREGGEDVQMTDSGLKITIKMDDGDTPDNASE